MERLVLKGQTSEAASIIVRATPNWKCGTFCIIHFKCSNLNLQNKNLSSKCKNISKQNFPRRKTNIRMEEQEKKMKDMMSFITWTLKNHPVASKMMAISQIHEDHKWERPIRFKSEMWLPYIWSKVTKSRKI